MIRKMFMIAVVALLALSVLINLAQLLSFGRVEPDRIRRDELIRMEMRQEMYERQRTLDRANRLLTGK